MERHLYYYEYVEAAFDDVLEILAERPETVLQGATDAAVRHAREIHAELVAPVAGFEIGREVTIEMGEIVRKDAHHATLPLTWQATQTQALFPSMRAELEVSALSNARPMTQIALAGEYTPPLGVVGAAGDAMFGHRVAEAAVHRLLNDIVANVERRLDS